MKNLVLLTLCGLFLAAPGARADEGKAFDAVNHTMMQGMMTAPTGDADQDFVTMMIPHHQGAIDMANVELKYGRDKELRALAEKILKAQGDEIAAMQTWQAAHPPASSRTAPH